MAQIVLMKRSFVTLALVASVIGSAIAIPHYVSAQVTNKDASASAAEGLQISPALVELNGEAGKSYTIQLQVLNVTASDLVFNSSVNDFTAKNESGTPSINLDSDTPSSASIKQWVSYIPQFGLQTHQLKKIDAVITIPANAEPGGHYGVIRFSGQAPELSGTGVGLTASAGTLVLVRVAGAANEKLDLETFAASKGGKAGAFFENGPITFIQRYKNSGSVHVKPIGQIEVRDSFGNKVATLPVNSAKGNVLPLSIRRFESTLNKNWLFGRYTADISVAYGSTGQAIVQTISFWVVPYKLVLAGLFILATIVYVLRIVLRRYKERIVQQALNKQSSSNAKTKNKRKKK